MREDISQFGIEDDTYITHFYQRGSGGQLTSDVETSDTCAKTVNKAESEHMRYYIKRGNGHFINPYDSHTKAARKNTYSWTKVQEETFNMYVEFLKTGYISQLRYAERSL